MVRKLGAMVLSLVIAGAGSASAQVFKPRGTAPSGSGTTTKSSDTKKPAAKPAKKPAKAAKASDDSDDSDSDDSDKPPAKKPVVAKAAAKKAPVKAPAHAVKGKGKKDEGGDPDFVKITDDDDDE